MKSFLSSLLLCTVFALQSFVYSPLTKCYYLETNTNGELKKTTIKIVVTGPSVEASIATEITTTGKTSRFNAMKMGKVNGQDYLFEGIKIAIPGKNGLNSEVPNGTWHVEGNHLIIDGKEYVEVTCQ